MAYCHLYQGNNSKALHYFRKATSGKDFPNYKLLADIYNNIGKIYYRENLLKYSMKYFYKSTRCSRKINNDELLAASYQCLGILFEKLEDITKSRNHFNRSLKIYRKLDSDSKKNQSLYIDKIITIIESIKNLDNISRDS